MSSGHFERFDAAVCRRKEAPKFGLILSIMIFFVCIVNDFWFHFESDFWFHFELDFYRDLLYPLDL